MIPGGSYDNYVAQKFEEKMEIRNWVGYCRARPCCSCCLESCSEIYRIHYKNAAGEGGYGRQGETANETKTASLLQKTPGSRSSYFPLFSYLISVLFSKDFESNP